MNWLDRLERRLGWLAVPNLIIVVVIGRGAAFLLAQSNPALLDYLVLYPDAVRRGEVWRLLTYVLLPPGGNFFFVLITLYFTMFLGRALEDTWGAFRFTVYYATGVLATAFASCVITGAPAVPYYLDLSLFFALATLFPDLPVLLLFFPIRIKWLALFSLSLQIVHFFEPGLEIKVTIVTALANYLLFFGPDLLRAMREAAAPPRRARAPEDPPPARPEVPVHRCTVCGATEKTRPDLEFRWCSCSRCGEGREFCREHLTDHQAGAAA